MSIHVSVATAVVRVAQFAYRTLLKPLWNLTLGPVFKRSHQIYLDRRMARHWEQMSCGLSYMLHRASSLTNDPNPVSILLIRNDGVAMVDRVEICVRAEKGIITYPDIIVVARLEPGRIAHVTLNNLPIEHVWVENEQIRTSYDSFTVFPLSLTRAGKVEEVSGGSPRMHPTYTDFLNGHWSRYWGQLYNTDAVNDYVRDTGEYFQWYFANQFGVEGIVSGPFTSAIQHRKPYLLPGVFLFWLLSHRPATVSICWTALIFRIHVLRPHK